MIPARLKRRIAIHAARQVAGGGFISGLKALSERDKRLAQTEIRRMSAQVLLDGQCDVAVDREARRRVRRSGVSMDVARTEVQNEARDARRNIAVRGAAAIGKIAGAFGNPEHTRVRTAARLEKASLQTVKNDSKLVLGGGAEKEIAGADRKLRRLERDIRRAFGTNPNLGAFGQAMEGKLAKEGRRHLDRFQGAHDREIAKIHALRDAAVGRMAAALAQKEGISKAQATERIEKESLARRLERQQPIVSALARVANALAEQGSSPRAAGFKESTMRDRFERGAAPQAPAPTQRLTPQDLERHQLADAASKESARWRGNEDKLDPTKHRTENCFLDNAYNDPKFDGHMEGSDEKTAKQKQGKKVKAEQKAEKRQEQKKAQRIDTLLNLDALKPHHAPKPTQDQALQDKAKPLTPEKPGGEKSPKRDGGIEMV